MKLRNRVREVRLLRQMTQETLAATAGVSRQTIIAIEKEGYAPSVTLALTLARALHMPIDGLFWLEQEV